MTFARVAIVLSLAALAGCATAPGDVKPLEPMQPIPVAAYAGQAPQGTQGAIYASNGGGLSLFADQRARDVGDLLTIELVEQTTAQTRSSTSIAKSSETSASAGSLFGGAPTINGRNVLEADLGAERDFSGSGDSAQSNRLQGSVTAVVIQRLPNGNLVVQGNKQVRLNQGDELVQVQGIVRPADIAPDNTIPSSRVAEARIVYGGRGQLARSNAMGWLGRFFNSPIFPM